MLIHLKGYGQKYSFTTKCIEHKHDENIFTIIVGKNGTGKSTLLASVIRNTLDYFNGSIKQTSLLFSDSSELFMSYVPDKVIAVSTSPFDKFPIESKTNRIKEYSYLGIRGLSTINIGLAYLSKISYSLVSSTLEETTKCKDITHVLNYLGYEKYLLVEFSLSMSISNVYSLIKSKDVVTKFVDYYLDVSPRGFNKEYFTTGHREYDLEKIKNVFDILKNNMNLFSQRDLVININEDGVEDLSENSFISKNFNTLMESGMIKLKSIEVTKKDAPIPIKINEASSGEQAVIISLLGISSKITNNSLICIDEPEICLHPAWQERYIELLLSIYKRYRGCHFLIATHSPQIISHLEKNNCYIMAMEDGIAIDAKNVINHSIDFQLAEVFKSPGFKNEYLVRELISFVSLISEGHHPDKKQIKNIKKILNLKKFISHNDPVIALMRIVEESLNEY